MAATLGLFALAALVISIAVAGVVLLPVAAGCGGLLYYYYNVVKPKREETELLRRTNLLFEQARKISLSEEDVADDLMQAGITDLKVANLAGKLFYAEGLGKPDSPPAVADTIAAARYRDRLQKYIEGVQPDQAKRFVSELIRILTYLQPTQTSGGFFRSARPRTRHEIEKLITLFYSDDSLFRDIRDQLNSNLSDEDDVFPSDCRHDDYAWRYLKGTPLLEFAQIEQDVELVDRMRHTYLLGSSGSGKTNLIENIIAGDLHSSEDCCIVVIDSQTQLINNLAMLDIEDVTMISPEWNLALNLFDVGYEKMKADGIEGETLINKTVGLISFAMEGLMGSEFSSPQKAIFQYGIQLVISIPRANIFTFMEILSDDGHLKYAEQIAAFDSNTQRFFEQDFGSNEYQRSREAIRRRLDQLLLNPTFRRLFTATENNFDMFAELRDQRMILIDTNKPLLDADASAFFGRLFIAMINRAAHMRFKNRHETYKPVYLIVDEAQEYFDTSITDMLEQARKANIGLTVAHQSISQAKGEGKPNIVDPLMVNTATKLISTGYRKDAAEFAGSMRISPDEILSLPQYTFGLHSRTQGFLPVRGKEHAFAGFPRRIDLSRLQAEMEARYGPSPEAARAASEEDPTRQDDPRPKGGGSMPPPPPGADIPDEPEMI